MNLEQTAIECGFDDAVTISTAELPFDFSFRKFCEANTCGNYGANYACPPYCGTPEEMREKALSYKKVIVLRKCVRINSLKDKNGLEKAQALIRNEMTETAVRFKNAGINGLASMPGKCRICDECEAKSGRACKSPQSIASCISAYCIDSKKLAAACNMEYICNDGKVAFFCLYLFDGEN